MTANMLKCLTALFWAGCSLLGGYETDGGWAGRRIAGVVTDSAGTPIGGVRVQGFIADVFASGCNTSFSDHGFRAWDTNEDGEYDARILEDVITAGAGPRCLSLEFLPPEGSGLQSVSIDSMRIHVHGTPDPQADALFRSDTLFINVVLPAAKPAPRRRH